MKVLGFVRLQLAASVLWQTSTVVIIALVLGVPLGVAGGRLIWRAFAGNLGVVVVPVVAAGSLLVVAVGSVVVANLLALGPAALASRTRPSDLLAVE